MTILLRSMLALAVTTCVGWFVVWAVVNLYGGIDSVAFAIFLNFQLMIWIVIMFGILAPDLEYSYFHPKKWERDGEIYLACGVHLFQSLLVRIRWEKIFRPGFSLKRSYTLIKEVELRTRGNEAAHGACLLVVLMFVIYAGILGSLKGVFFLLVTGIFFQAYPVMLQRYLRPRYRRIMASMEATENDLRS